MYLYGFYARSWNIAEIKIEKFEIIKETEKQYKMKGYPCVIRKATMSVDNYCFYLTEEEAIKGLIDHCNWCIDCSKRTIDYEHERIKDYENLIKKLEGKNEIQKM